MTKDAGKNDKAVEILGLINNAKVAAYQVVSKELIAEYRRTDEYKEKGEESVDVSTFLSDSATRVNNDFLVAQVIVDQEGKIPPKNVFAGKEDLVRRSLADLDGDRGLIQALHRGTSKLCVHEGDIDGPARSLGSILAAVFKGKQPDGENNEDIETESENKS